MSSLSMCKAFVYKMVYNKHLWLVALIGWALLIFLFSAFPRPFAEPQFDIEVILRKLGHFSVFYVFMGLLFKVLWDRTRWSFGVVLLWASVGSVVYAISDETHQILVPGRHATVTDVIIDAFGILMMVVTLSLLRTYPKDFEWWWERGSRW